MNMSGTPIGELNNIYPQNISGVDLENKDYSDINSLTQDLNESLAPDDMYYDDVPELEGQKSDNMLVYYLKRYKYVLYQAITVIVLYIILSQQPVIKNVSKVVPQIKADANGNVPFLGIAIYGGIFAILFIIISILILKFL